MTEVINNIYLLPMLISAILSLKAFRLRWPLSYRLFSILLFTVLFTEVFASLWIFYLHNAFGWQYTSDNIWIYTSSFIPQYVLYMAVYHQVLHSPRLKKLIVLIAILFSVFVIFNFSFWQKAYQINSYTHIIADCIVLLLVFSYFEQVRREKEIVNLTTQPMVWISLGALLFHLTHIPFFVTLNYLNKEYLSVAISFARVNQIALIISYILFAKAFLCPTPQQK